MEVLKPLTEEEQRILIHKVQNSNRSKTFTHQQLYLQSEMNNELEKQLAKLSEDENYNLKNRYRHQRRTMDWADKKRMPVDETKIVDMLKNQSEFRVRMDREIGTFSAQQHNPQAENGILTMINEVSTGEMRELVREIGIDSSLEFMNVGEYQKKRDSLLKFPGDHNFSYLMNALFTPLDMTDYENTFVGYDEVGGDVPLNNLHLLKPCLEESWPVLTDDDFEEPEPRKFIARSKTHLEMQEARAAQEEADADAAAEEAEAEAEEAGDEGEEGEGEGEGEEAEEEEFLTGLEELDVPKEKEDYKRRIEENGNVFIGDENLKNNFNEIELDSFMKLLNVKPYR